MQSYKPMSLVRYTQKLAQIPPQRFRALYSGLSGKSGDDFNQDDNPDNKGFIPFTNIANNTYLKRDH